MTVFTRLPSLLLITGMAYAAELEEEVVVKERRSQTVLDERREGTKRETLWGGKKGFVMPEGPPPCASTTDCADGQTCYNENCVTNGTYRFSLSWQGDANLDLRVALPNGEVVDSDTNDPSSSATFDYVTGNQRGSLYDDNIYVESIFFTSDSLPSGRYAIIADQSSDATVENVYTMSVFDQDGQIFESFGTFFAGSSDQEQVYYFPVA